MLEDLKKLKDEALNAISAAADVLNLEELENRFLGRKSGELTAMMKGLKDLADDAKREAGAVMNEVKSAVSEALATKRNELAGVGQSEMLSAEKIDITQPSLPIAERGHFHPLTLVQQDLEDLFLSMGFMVLDGPELESDYYCFDALNIPKTHPARDMQDTFYIKNHPGWVMRTHTSSMQVRTMQDNKPPMKVIMPGRCYRNEATDARHEHTFFQLEGFVIDEKISLANMKGILELVAKNLYGPDTRVRLRPKFYPFVEPGVNGEVACFLCKSKGCRVCKHTGWLEIFGAGMIHPNVLEAGAIDSKKYQGFAFGFGLDRLVMLKYGVEDIRHFQGGDIRFLTQF